MALAVAAHAHVASLGAGGAVLGGLGLVHLGLKGAAIAGVGAGLKTAAKLGVISAGLAVGHRLRRQNSLSGGEPGLITTGGIDDITTIGGGVGDGGLGGSDSWSNGLGDSNRGIGGDDGRWDGRWDGNRGNDGNDGRWGGNDGAWNGNQGNDGNDGRWGGNWGNDGRWGGDDGNRGNDDGNRGNDGGNRGNDGGNRGGDGIGNNDWNDGGSSLGHWTLVGPPKGASHITLLQGKSSHGGDLGGIDSIRRNGLGDGIGKGDKKG